MARRAIEKGGAILRIGALHIHPSAIFLPALIYFLNAGYFVLLTAIAVLAHELGHYALLRLWGGEVKRIKLWIGGVSMVYGGLGYAGEAVTALMGPGASLSLALASALFGRVFSYVPAYHLAGLSMLLAIFNMLPVFPLDGGRAMFSIIAKVLGLPAAERIRRICNLAFTGVLGVLGAAMLWLSGNPTVLITAGFLALGAARSGENGV